MKILILGGTGAMGFHLVQLLSNDSMDVYVTSRTARSPQKNVKYIHGNAHDIAFLKNLLKQRWDTIVDFMVYDTLSFKARVNILLKATHQYIFLSSARTYADSESPITETSPRLLDISSDSEYLETDEYALTKARQEDILRNSGYNNWTIIRPYITYSENRLQLGVLEKEEWLYRALHGRTIIFAQELMSKQTTLTYGLDVAKGIQAIIGKMIAIGETYHITAQESITWNEVLSIYLDVLHTYLGYRPKVLLKDVEQFSLLKPGYGKYQLYYDRMYNRVFNNTKIAKYVDINKFTKIETGLKKCLEDFLKSPSFTAINWEIEALRDKQAKEQAKFKEILGTKIRLKYLLHRYFI